MKNKHCLLACGFIAVLCILLENWTPFDLTVQRVFYQQEGWLISKVAHAKFRWLYYDGVKIVIGLIGGLALALALLSLRTKILKRWRHFCCVLFLSIALVPLFIAGLKAITGVYSPNALLPFGGKHLYIGMLTHLLDYGVVDGGRSFPAGHASGGFALMSLYYLPVKKAFRYAGLLLGLAAGWAMGLYQMARGEHFLTHTLTTMFLAWVIILCINYAYQCSENYWNFRQEG